MSEEKKDYGKANLGYGTPEEREVSITSFCRLQFPDHRLCTTFKLETDAYCLVVENPPSTGREPINQMYLSKESLMGVLASAIIHLSGEGVDFEDILSEITNGKDIQYELTPNLKPLSK